MSVADRLDREHYVKFGPGGERRGDSKASSMTIREAFAMAALQGIIANGSLPDKTRAAVCFADELLARLAE